MQQILNHILPAKSAWSRVVHVLAGTLLFVAPTLAQDEVITEGTVAFTVDYEDMGPMGAMLPKSEQVMFRPGQMRVESGMNVSLYGVVPGRKVSLLALDTHKLAFLIRVDEAEETGSETSSEDSLLRYETMEEERTIAGLPARQVDGVDREDETNRLSYWLTNRLEARFPAEGHLPRGFALDYVVLMNDGSAHKVATSIDTTPLEDQLFTIPDDYQRIEIDSEREISKHLGEVMGRNIQVVE